MFSSLGFVRAQLHFCFPFLECAGCGEFHAHAPNWAFIILRAQILCAVRCCCCCCYFWSSSWFIHFEHDCFSNLKWYAILRLRDRAILLPKVGFLPTDYPNILLNWIHSRENSFSHCYCYVLSTPNKRVWSAKKNNRKRSTVLPEKGAIE